MNALDSLNIDTALAAQAEKEAAADEIGQNNFLTMLVAQLENQDPLNPQDSADFAAQLAHFSSVEQLVAMRAGIDALVSNAAGPADPTAPVTGASNLDPTNLVGKYVTVFGSQIDVDERQSPIAVNFRSIDNAIEAEVVITNAEGREVHRESILPVNADGVAAYLRPGDHVYRFNPAEHNLPPGVYGIEFTASGQGDEPVTLLPMIDGLVTGAVLAGEPSIRMGNRIFAVGDVLEVRLSDEANTNRGRGSGARDPGTGGGQTVLQPDASQRPNAGSGS